MKKKALAIITAVALTTMAAFTGCGTDQQAAANLPETGVITLSVNPEIEIEYDKNGTVVEVRGNNEDGVVVVDSYQGYVGQDCETVLSDLINKIHEAGYFIDEVDGSVRKIVIELEEGSYIPDADFLRGLGESAQATAKGLDLSTNVSVNNAGDSGYDDTDYGPSNDGVTDYDDTDYDPNNDGVTDYDDTDYGPNNDGVTDYDDTDYGPNNDGVTDYDDTDYGPNNDGVTDYDDTDYGPNNDGVTDYNDTDYGPNNDGVTDYNDAASDYDNGSSNYGSDYEASSNYGSDYGSDYDD